MPEWGAGVSDQAPPAAKQKRKKEIKKMVLKKSAEKIISMAYELYETGQASLPQNLQMPLDVNGYVVFTFCQQYVTMKYSGENYTAGQFVERFMKLYMEMMNLDE